MRSDSDLFTYGYRFKPWRGPSIAAGEEILAYLDEVIDEDGLGQYIRYQHRVMAASWSTGDRRWTVEVTRDDTGQQLRFTTGFLWMCQGYYNHAKPYRPQWEGMDRFRGVVVHPQRWPEDLDLAGKRVVVIGSGATAATLIPAVAGQAEHVTMLQRSPSYYFAPPATTRSPWNARRPGRPRRVDHEILRRQFMAANDLLARMSFEAPDGLHTFLVESMRPLLPAGVDVDKHFTPRYRPWQQRIAVVPDGDLFAALREGKASIVTDTIEAFTENGIKVSSGEEIPADIVVTATGFNMSVLGDVAFTVDGEPVDFTERVTWRGIMINGLPNMAYVFGYFRYRLDPARGPGQRPGGPPAVTHAGQRRHDGGPHPATPGDGHAAAAVLRSGELQPRLCHALAAHLVQARRSRALDPPAGTRPGARDPARGGPRRRDARLPLSPAGFWSRLSESNRRPVHP